MRAEISSCKRSIIRFHAVAAAKPVETLGKKVKREGGVLKADGALSKGELVFSVPERLCMSKESAQKSEIGPLLAEYDIAEDHMAIALQLLHERARGEKSQYAPILEAVEAPCDAPLFWSEEELAGAAGTVLGEATGERRAYVAGVYAALEEALEEAALFGAKPTLEDLLRAYATARARCFPVRSGTTTRCMLVPGAAAAPAPGPGAELQLGKVGGILGMGGEAVVKLEAGRAHSAGEAVEMSYGPGALLPLDYGLRAPGPALAFALALEPTVRFAFDRLEVAASAGYGPREVFSLSPEEPFGPVDYVGTDGEPEADFLAYARLVALDGPDCFHLEPLFRADAWEGHFKRAVSPENEAAVVEAALARLAAWRAASEEIDLDAARAALADPATPRAAASPPPPPSTSARLCARPLRPVGGALTRGGREAVGAAFARRQARLEALEYYQERRLREKNLTGPLSPNEIFDF
eukprot:tig00001229_g7836.t1